MKTAVYIGGLVESGGGFNQSINAIMQVERLTDDDVIVVTTIKENVRVLKELGIRAKYIRPSIIDAFIRLSSLSLIVRWFQSRFKIIGGFEKELIRDGVDLVYFLTPSIYSILLQKLNYIMTVWDLCHRDFCEFPEVREYNEFFYREDMYSRSIPAASIIIADSQQLKNKIIEQHHVDEKRIIAMPFSISPYFRKETYEKVDVFSKYNLEKDYFFYPAQFWAHKNHIRILESLVLLNGMGRKYHVVFCGSDKGNLSHVQEYIEKESLQDQIKILGFVPTPDIQELYQCCLAVVMPTYFGPTNIPPLEAWHFCKPLIYSQYYYNQVEGAALLVDPDSAEELAQSMLRIFDSKILRKKLVNEGRKRLDELEEDKKKAEENFCELLSKFKDRRRCWP